MTDATQPLYARRKALIDTRAGSDRVLRFTAAVHVSKWSAWSLLVIMSFTIVTNLKHVKATVHVPE